MSEVEAITDLERMELALIRQWEREAGKTTRIIDRGHWSSYGRYENNKWVRSYWIPNLCEEPIEP